MGNRNETKTVVIMVIRTFHFTSNTDPCSVNEILNKCNGLSNTFNVGAVYHVLLKSIPVY